MKNERQILDEVERTLHSIDKLKNLEDNHFLFTRIKSEIENRSIKRKKTLSFGLELKPIVLVLIILINIITLIYSFKSNTNKTASSSLVSVLQKDYQINQISNEF